RRVQQAPREHVGPVEVAAVNAGEAGRVGEVEVKGGQHAHVEVDEVGQLHGVRVRPLDGPGQVTGDGVSHGAGRRHPQGAEQLPVNRAGPGDGGGAGQLQGVRVGDDDGVAVRVHEVDELPVGVGPGGDVVVQLAGERAGVLEVADDPQGDVEHGRGEDLRQQRGLLGV